MIRATLLASAVLAFTLFGASCAQDPIQEELILMQPDGFSETEEEEPDGTIQLRPDGYSETAEEAAEGTVELRQDGYSESEEEVPEGTDQSRPDGYEPPGQRKKLPTPPPTR